ncbi:MAG: precorrin-6A reductase [Spirochaetaceae bacterium]|jgi:precorrin-6x reductase|nr:precorrin-6A reductase [Spirochaetaceae bacterium]
MRKILVFAGTGDGRALIQRVLDGAQETGPLSIHACAATRYGRELLEAAFKAGGYGEEAVTVYGERLDAEGIFKKIQALGPCYVIDCTHPYAAEAAGNIKAACGRAGVPYVRLKRETASFIEGAVYVDTMEEAARFLLRTTGRVFLAVGSKGAGSFACEPLRERVFLRILPVEESIRLCRSQGFSPKQIIALQGPVSEALNQALLRETGAAWLVTKETGAEGGFPEKARAAAKEGVKLLVVRPPFAQEGRTGEEICRIILRDEA